VIASATVRLSFNAAPLAMTCSTLRTATIPLPVATSALLTTIASAAAEPIRLTRSPVIDDCPPPSTTIPPGGTGLPLT